MTEQTPTATMYPLTIVALAASGLALVLTFTVSRFEMGMALAVGVATLILSIAAGSAAQREKRGGIVYARIASILSVVVVIIALTRMG